MGVKVYTSACTLAETSVRPDMVIALLKAFARHYHQVVLVSEAAFVKHMLDVGESSRMDWKSLRMHVLLGEEPLAENARKYIEGILGIDSCQDGSPLVCSSMGIGEFGMHCFAEVPPARELIRLRRALHDDRELRSQLISHDWVPPIFTYDPQRFYVEIDDDRRLLITTLADNTRIPLIRYAPGDFASWLHLPRHLQSKIERAGVSWSLIQNLPLLLMEGRGRYADSACGRVYPEEVKEGIYLRPELAKQTTANFRLVPGLDHVRIRIQLSAGMVPSDDLNLHFETAIGEYTKTPIEVQCEAYLQFGAGMVLDYERKFDYFGN
jgi:phenylacetate-CoA ligase